MDSTKYCLLPYFIVQLRENLILHKGKENLNLSAVCTEQFLPGNEARPVQFCFLTTTCGNSLFLFEMVESALSRQMPIAPKISPIRFTYRMLLSKSKYLLYLRIRG